MYMSCTCIYIPAAERTSLASPGNENVRKTIVALAAILAPSPESFRVTLVCSARSPSFNLGGVHCFELSNLHHTCTSTFAYDSG